MREPSGDQAGDPNHHAMYDLAMSRGVPPFASTTYRPWSIRVKTTFVPSGENEPSLLRPSLVSGSCEPSACMTQRSCGPSPDPSLLTSLSSSWLPSRDQATGDTPSDGPMEIRWAGCLGSTAHISVRSAYVIYPS